jgi:hypothetical protein
MRTSRTIPRLDPAFDYDVNVIGKRSGADAVPAGGEAFTLGVCTADTTAGEPRGPSVTHLPPLGALGQIRYVPGGRGASATTVSACGGQRIAHPLLLPRLASGYVDLRASP